METGMQRALGFSPLNNIAGLHVVDVFSRLINTIVCVLLMYQSVITNMITLIRAML